MIRAIMVDKHLGDFLCLWTHCLAGSEKLPNTILHHVKSCINVNK